MQFHFETGKNGLGTQKKKNQQELVNFFSKGGSSQIAMKIE